MPTENKPAEPLKVERSTVTKLVITGAPRGDAMILAPLYMAYLIYKGPWR